MGIATLIAGPTVEPLDLDTLKPQLRIVPEDTTHDASLLSLLIPAARAAAEGRTQRALLSQRWRYRTECFPCDIALVVDGSQRRYPGHFYLPRPNLISVETFKYIDVDGVEQTLDPSAYKLDTDSEPGIVYAAVNTVWPKSLLGVPGVVSIEYTAGYGTSPDSVPADLKRWMIALIAYWFENPKGAETEPGLTTSVPAEFLSEMISSYIVHHVAGSR